MQFAVFPSDIATEVRQLTNRQDSNFPTDDELFTFISKGVSRINSEIGRVAPQAIAEEYSFMRSSTQATYDLPVDYGGYLIRALDITEDPEEPLDLVHYRELDLDKGSETERVAIKGTKIQLGPEPNTNDSSDAIRVEYARSPENVHGGTLDSAGATKKVKLPASPSSGTLRNYDSAYVNHQIEITSGKGVSQRRKISKWTASTRVAEVENDFDTAPSASDSYEILAEIPRLGVAREALVSYVAKSVMRKDEMADNMDVRDFNSAMRELKGTIVQEGYHSSPGNDDVFVRSEG